jgi:hypothetical protein
MSHEAAPQEISLKGWRWKGAPSEEQASIVPLPPVVLMHSFRNRRAWGSSSQILNLNLEILQQPELFASAGSTLLLGR